MVIVAVATSASASFVLLLLVCGVIVILLVLRSRSSKDVSMDRVTHPSDTEPFYETVLPRVLEVECQDQDFELKDNIAYGPVCSPAVTRSRAI